MHPEKVGGGGDEDERIKTKKLPALTHARCFAVRRSSQMYDHFYEERKDMTTPVVTFPMASNYRIVPTLPIPIYVVAEAGFTLPKNTVGCVFVVSSKSVTAVCSDNSCFTLSDFEDLILPAPLAR